MSQPRLSLTASSLAVVLIAESGAPPPQPAPWSAAMKELATPAAQNSAQPQLSSSARGIVLSWIERSAERATLKYAEWAPGGWSPARTVASGTDWFVNWADVPSVVRLANGTIAAHWLQKSGADTYAYDVRLSYSHDDGKTCASSFLPHSDGNCAAWTAPERRRRQ